MFSMNITIQNCVFLCLIAFLASCSAPKEVLYLQDIASIKEENIDKNYEVIIHKDDLLAILVNSKDPELALPFNMPVVTYQIGAQTTAQQRLLGYLVDQNGDIDFPILLIIILHSTDTGYLLLFSEDRSPRIHPSSVPVPTNCL